MTARDSIQRLGITQSRTARLLGVSIRAVENWCSPTGSPPMPVARLLDIIETVPDAMERLEELSGETTGNVIRASRES